MRGMARPVYLPSSAHSVPASVLTTSLLLVMALACGIFVANIYYNQPILALLQHAFPQSVALVNLVPTATQLGFACGLFLLIPLGDKIDRRKLILVQGAALCVALVCLALAPNVWTLIIASVAVGVTGSVVQQIVPFAAELATHGRRGQVVGAVMSALVWLLLLFRLPHSQPKTNHRYVDLMKSLVALWREEPLLRRATYIQAALFGAFIGLWTILALHLQDAFGLGAEVAGLMGIVGAVGILMAPLAGRIADQRGPYAVLGLGCVIMLVSYVVLGVWGSIIGLIVGIILVDLGEQSALISNQHVVYALRPEARSRLNTLFMSGMFLGGRPGHGGPMSAGALVDGIWPACF